MVGGYKIVDLKNKNHTPGVGMVHTDIYDEVEATKKPILLSNIVIDDTEYKDTYVTVVLNESDYKANVYGYTLTINSNDVVTFEL